MSDPELGSVNKEGETEAPLSIGEVLGLLRKLAEIAGHAAETRGLDWSPRHVLKMISGVIQANTHLREVVKRLEQRAADERRIASLCRTAMHDVLSFYETEIQKLGVPREAITALTTQARATIPPESSNQEAGDDPDLDERARISESYFPVEATTGVRTQE
jgi:hypothetical protein